MNESESWKEERQSAFLYRVIADRETVEERRRLFLKLAEAAEAQAQHWQKLAADKGMRVPTRFSPALRARLVARLIQWLGPRRLLPMLAAMKVRGLSVYAHGPAGGHDAPIAGRSEERRVGKEC